MEVEIRPAQAHQLPEIRSVLTRSLAQDPLMRWYFPDGEAPEQRLGRIAMYLGPSMEWLVGCSTAHAALVDGVIVGAALWMEPGTPVPQTLPSLRGLAEILMGQERAQAVHAGMRAARQGAAEISGVYLSLAGVAEQWRGRGLGARLLEPVLSRGPGTCWLESTNPRNVPFYERAGFRVVHEAPVGGSGVTMARLVGEF